MRSVRRVVTLGAEVNFSARRTFEEMDAPRLPNQRNRHHETHGGVAFIALRRCAALWRLVGHRRASRYWREHVVSLCRRLPETPGRWYMTTHSDCRRSAKGGVRPMVGRATRVIEPSSGHSRRRPKGRLRQPWGSAPAPLRACARHHSSCATLRLRFNLPQPGVSIIRAAPQFDGSTHNRKTRGCCCLTCPPARQWTRRARVHTLQEIVSAVGAARCFRTVAEIAKGRGVGTSPYQGGGASLSGKTQGDKA
jgi:hypothetical protein